MKPSSAQHASWAFGLMGVVILLAMVWVAALRRRVRAQTETLVRRLERITALQERFRDLFENAHDVIFTTDLEGDFTSLNKAGERITGYSRDDALRLNIAQVVSPEHREKALEAFRKTAQEGRSTTRELEVLGAQGRRVPLELSIRRIEHGGKPVEVQAIARDIRERKRAAEELQKAKEAAEAANRAKSEFLAMMSHEIRTPMNGILGMTELALDTPLTPEQREYLAMVKTSADALLTVINDILDFSKIEAGKLELDRTEFNLHASLANSLKMLALRAHTKGLELSYQIPPDVPGAVLGDPVRLRQVILNLAGNAIKFTERGEVIFQVETETRREEEVRLHFSVSDTGMGIPQEKQKIIFEAFTQMDTSSRRKYGGTGLGLAISARLVEMMGGCIWVQSEPGRGSTFHFTATFGLPKKVEERPSRSSADELRDLPVLVVDDNRTSRRILEQTLLGWSMEPVLSESGRAGLAAMEEALAADSPFPLVLIDARMPDMDGFTLAEKIKQTPRLAGAVIMMLTSAGLRGDAARCRELGISAYLTKPVRPSDLFDAIVKVLNAKDTPSERARLVTVHSLRESRQKLRILLAEDNPVNQAFVVRLLEKNGHSVAVAKNGREALATLEGSPFDLILMDVQMPEMDGFETTRAIREREKTTGKRLGIIALTAHAMKGDRERCLAAGMDRYISKPVQPGELLTAIGKLIPDLQETTSTEEISSAIAPSGDTRLLAEMAGLFLRDCPKLMSEIRRALDRHDAKGLERAAHTLKGSVSNFAARAAFEAARHLETLGREADLAQAEAACRRLEDEIERLKPALASLEGETAL